MKSVNKAVRLLAAAALLGGSVMATSEAATLSVSPSAQTIAPGGTASVDILLSGLAANETVGGFSFILSFNNAVLGAPSSATVDPATIMGPGALDLGAGFTGGGSPFDVFYVADLALTEAALKAAEGTGFTLATVNLTGLSEGLSLLSLTTAGAFLSNFDGTADLPASVVNGAVCVDDPGTPGDRCAAAVPEPGTLALGLLGASFAALIGRRRRGLELQQD